MAKTYAEKLRSPHWQKKRLEVLDRDNWSCKHCQDKETFFNVHHLKYTDNFPANEPIENLITVCEHCHKYVCHNKDVEIDEISFLEKTFTDWGICYLISFKTKDIIMTVDKSERQDIIIFQKGSIVLKNLAKLNISKNGRG